MSKLELTEKEINDIEREWTGDELFRVTNGQLHEIIAARGMEADAGLNKRALVKVILDEQSAAKDMENEGGATAGEVDLEVGAQNIEAAASILPDGLKDDEALAGAEVDVRFREVEVKPPVGDSAAMEASGPGVREWENLDSEEKEQYVEAAKNLPAAGERMEELDKRMAKDTIGQVMYKARKVEKTNDTLHGHIDDLPNPLLAKA